MRKRSWWIGLVMVLALVGCGGEEAPPDDADESASPSSEPSGLSRVELTLAAWPQFSERPLSDFVTATEAKTLLGLAEVPGVEKSDYAENWRYRWRGDDGKRNELNLDLMPITDEATIQLNANGYARAAEDGLGEAVDLGADGVLAFWRPERKKGRLIVFTRTAVFNVGIAGLPLDEGKAVVEKVARHMFETNR